MGEQAGPPQELYHHPATRFVASFIGSPSMNFLDATLETNDGALRLVLADGTTLRLPAERAVDYAGYLGRKVALGVRPEHLVAAVEMPSRIEVTVDVVEPLGQETLIYFSFAGAFCCARIDPYVRCAPGERLKLGVQMDRIHLIDAETDRIIRSSATAAF